MISVSAAKKIIEENVKPLPAVQVDLQDAAGMLLAADVHASQDIPAFNQSSVDGYAIEFAGWKKNKTLSVKGVVPAGFGGAVPFSRSKL